MKPFVLSVVLVLFATGCASTDQIVLDTTPRPPTVQVDIYTTADAPAGVHAIAELTFLGPAQDELRAQKFFVHHAQQLGGDAIIFWKADASADVHSGFGQSGGEEHRFLFHAKVIVYEKPRNPSRPNV